MGANVLVNAGETYGLQTDPTGQRLGTWKGLGSEDSYLLQQKYPTTFHLSSHVKENTKSGNKGSSEDTTTNYSDQCPVTQTTLN